MIDNGRYLRIAQKHVARVACGLVLKLGPMKAALVLIGPVAGILENHLTELAKVMRS